LEKTFLLFQPSKWNERYGALAVVPACCITANNIEEAVEKTGGKLAQRLIPTDNKIEVEHANAVVFDRCLFNPIEGEDVGAGEYQKGELLITIQPDEKEVVYFIKEIQHIP
jgi:hypothetical protein